MKRASQAIEIADLIEKLQFFIQGAEIAGPASFHRAHLRTDHVELSVRIGRHVISGTTPQSLDLVDITIAEDWRGRGTLKAILRWLEQRQPFEGIYVENVLSRLSNHLRQRGYEEVPGSSPPCFFLRTGQLTAIRA
ncbi:MAG TPA: hypothetical protein VK735_40225 [Pseudonocardia sp.]|uniref:hypothetical protein n=1 Tax=Pseudonocardia sp. TaxID=60912 RepID=UPI002BD4631F|nr:hypothetical protein [Pseudonocardia sp.]HTF53713.1 hypothetical protein [Pseudonocardia sp.]